MWFSKIDEFTCQGSKVTSENIKILITEKGMLQFFFFFFLQKKFASRTAVGLGDMYKFHHLGVILAPLVLLKRPYLELERSLYSVTHTNI